MKYLHKTLSEFGREEKGVQCQIRKRGQKVSHCTSTKMRKCGKMAGFGREWFITFLIFLSSLPGAAADPLCVPRRYRKPSPLACRVAINGLPAQSRDQVFADQELYAVHRNGDWLRIPSYHLAPFRIVQVPKYWTVSTPSIGKLRLAVV